MNPQRPEPQSGALPIELHPPYNARKGLVRQKGLEPPTYCLEGSCSIRMSYWRGCGAGDENRTRIPSLEGWCPDHCATPARPVRYVSLPIIAGFRALVKDFRKFFFGKAPPPLRAHGGEAENRTFPVKSREFRACRRGGGPGQLECGKARSFVRRSRRGAAAEYDVLPGAEGRGFLFVAGAGTERTARAEPAPRGHTVKGRGRALNRREVVGIHIEARDRA